MWSSCWNDKWLDKPKYSENTWSSATLSTTNPTWPDLGLNLDLSSEEQVTNYLSYGMPFVEQSSNVCNLLLIIP
jgi:hypothetical protein